MDNLQNLFFIIFGLIIIIEILWSLKFQKNTYNLKESMANAFIIIGAKLIKPISLAWGLFIFEWASQFKLIHIPLHIVSIVFTFMIVEFVYYWYHRLSHTMPILWTIHHTHHSSPWFNIFTSGRLNWMGKFVSVFFYIPLVILGFSPTLITASLAISLIYQIFLHTEMVGNLGFMEGLFFNTPSAHRVHHGSNEKYLDRNYGGMLIIYDRIFGTYIPENEKVFYGVTSGFMGHNPIKILFSPLFSYLKNLFKLKINN